MKESIVSPLYEPPGKLSGRPSKSEQLKDAILNSLSAQIAVLDPEGIIETVNESWKLFVKENEPPEFSGAEYTGINYLEICGHPESRFSEQAPAAVQGILAILNGSASSFNLEYPYHVAQSKRWYVMSVTALPHSLGAIVSHTDISGRKEIEQMKEDFVSIAAHELKTPLTSLKGIVHILQLSFLKKMRGDGAKLLSTMDVQLDKLTKIIGHLLDVNTIPGDEISLNCHQFDFKELVEETVENVRNISPLHFLCVKKNERIICNGDKLRLEQVITNLLTNAVKYSPQSNQVVIRSVINNSNILLSVQDFGIGIDKENVPRIFERFYRVNNGMRFGGLGLGLYISSKIIKAHKGDLWVESSPGKGSIFYFSLPVN